LTLLFTSRKSHMWQPMFACCCTQGVGTKAEVIDSASSIPNDERFIADQAMAIQRKQEEASATAKDPKSLEPTVATFSGEKLESLASTVVVSSGKKSKPSAPILEEEPRCTAPTSVVSSREKPNTYQISLTKQATKSVGINVDWGKMTKLEITEITGGLVADWNASNPEELQVKVGDYVCEVNGAEGDARVLLDMVRRSDVLNITIRRG